MTPEELLQDLTTQLGLTFEPQDWGIVNANPSRLGEFIRFYESHALAPSQRFELGELVLASANERLLADGNAADPEIDLLIGFLNRHGAEQTVHLQYWSSLQPAQSYPIAALLRRLGQV